ncbi:DoxX family protein [Nocardiopsis ansamitocini]|uniref:DoxX family protein n=1 Tax=Nocardiopsis ansamitocini TaxID=1670832 RepID=A0A9W6UH32_9ACTN|nr:DoxX family protein [Nocardiopsis ansamitocini]GLU48406.1 hypothetical protein Nans01_27570 [Nocardiopsis ansamitocini]
MNTALWVVQIVLAAMFVMAGVVKATRTKDELAPKMPWVEDFGATAVKAIGVTELLGGLGLVLPAATGVATVLTPLAAAGLAVTMALAAVVHLRRKEYSGIVFNAVLLALAAFVAWGRFGPYPL